MIFFIVGVSLLLGTSPSLRVHGLEINGPECGIPTRGMIVNGTVAERNQFPWMVKLRIYDKYGQAFGCGGKHPNQAPHSHCGALHLCQLNQSGQN
ncbi:hypothetical protein MTO96_032690 [Rhipicephalus appendiculatus]